MNAQNNIYRKIMNKYPWREIKDQYRDEVFDYVICNGQIQGIPLPNGYKIKVMYSNFYPYVIGKCFTVVKVYPKNSDIYCMTVEGVRLPIGLSWESKEIKL